MSEAKKVFKGAFFLFSAKMIERSLGLVSTLILARVLVPDDFGLVAIAHLVIGFVSKSMQAGGGQYLIQKQDVSSEDINTSWTINLLLRGVIFTLLLALTPFASGYYSDPRLMAVIPILASMIIVGAFGNPYVAILQRNQEYSVIFKINIIKKVSSVFFTVSVALIFRSYWALILGHLISSAVGTIISYIYIAYRPKFNLSGIKEQWGFSKWMLAKGVLGYTRGQLDTFMVSSFYSPSQLGGFHISKYISSMPGSEGITPALEPLLATFSRAIKGADEIKHQLCLVLIILMATSVPLSLFIYVFSESIILLLLGQQWLEFATIFGILGFLTVTAGVGKIATHIIIAEAKVKLLFMYDLYSLIFIGGVLYFFSSGSLEAFSIVRVTTEFIVIAALFIAGTYHILGALLIPVFLLTALYTACSLGLTLVTKLLFINDIHVFLSLTISGLLFLLLSSGLCWLFFKLFLVNNKAALHVVYLLNGVKGKCLIFLNNKLSSIK